MLLAVLVVALGGLMSMWAVSSYAHRDRVLVISADVAVGQRITADDLTGADLTLDPRVSAFTVAQQGEVIGQVALVDLARGTLVNPSQVGASPLLTAGQVLVPLQLKPGQLPAVGVAPGQLVWLVDTPVDTGQGAQAGAQPSAQPSAVDPIEATVAESGDPDPATLVTVVDVRVPQDQGVSLARMAASGNVTVVLLPAGGGKWVRSNSSIAPTARGSRASRTILPAAGRMPRTPCRRRSRRRTAVSTVFPAVPASAPGSAGFVSMPVTTWSASGNSKLDAPSPHSWKRRRRSSPCARSSSRRSGGSIRGAVWFFCCSRWKV